MTATVVAVVLIVGFAARALVLPRSRTTSDLFIAIRPPGPTLLATGLAAEHLSGAGLVALFAVGRDTGPGGAWLAGALTGGLAGLVLVAAGPVRRAGLASLAELGPVRFADDRLARRLDVAALVATTLLLVPTLQTAVFVTVELIPVGTGPAAVVVVAVVLAAGAIFRGRGSLYAQQIRLLAMAAGLGSAAALRARGRPLPVVSALDEVAEPPVAAVAVTAAVIVWGSVATPHLWARLQAAATVDAARRALLASAGIVAALGVVALAVGADTGATDRAATPLDRALTGLVLAGLASGCLATASSLTLAGLASVRRLGAQEVIPGLALVVLPAAALALETLSVGPLLTLVWAYGVIAAMSPPIVAGLWLRSVSVQGMQAGIAVGLVSSLVVVAARWGAVRSGAEPSLGSLAMLVPIAASGLAVLVGSRHRPDRSVEGLLRLHRPRRQSLALGGEL